MEPGPPTTHDDPDDQGSPDGAGRRAHDVPRCSVISALSAVSRTLLANRLSSPSGVALTQGHLGIATALMLAPANRDGVRPLHPRARPSATSSRPPCPSWHSTRGRADGPWPAPTPGRHTRSPSRLPRQARGLRTRRSQTSHGDTRTRSSRTTRQSPTWSAPGDSKRPTAWSLEALPGVPGGRASRTMPHLSRSIEAEASNRVCAEQSFGPLWTVCPRRSLPAVGKPEAQPCGAEDKGSRSRIRWHA